MLIIQIALFSRDQKWRQQFQDYGLEWLDAIGGYFEILVHRVIGHDVWRAVDVNITRSQLRTLRRKQERLIPRGPIGGKAASVPSLTPSLHSAFDTVVPSTSAPSKVGFFFIIRIKTLKKVLNFKDLIGVSNVHRQSQNPLAVVI